jgi:hypothetical protein
MLPMDSVAEIHQNYVVIQLTLHSLPVDMREELLCTIVALESSSNDAPSCSLDQPFA